MKILPVIFLIGIALLSAYSIFYTFFAAFLYFIFKILVKKNILDNYKIAKFHAYLKHVDWVASISIALIIVFIVTLLTAYLFPIYSDEIQVRFWLSRLPYDYPLKISGAPTCLATFFQPIPASMYVPGLIDWAVHGQLESPSSLRQIGFFIAFLWIALLAFYLNFRAKNSLAQGGSDLCTGFQSLYIVGFIITIFSIGVFPIFLIMNRGEQLILPSVVFLITIFLVSNHLRYKGNFWVNLGLIVIYFIAISMALYGHPKSLFLTPFFVIVAWPLFRNFKSRLPFIFTMLLLALNIVDNFLAWKYAFKCSEVPQFEAQLKSFSFDPASLIYDPRQFLYNAHHSFIRFTNYLHQIGFQQQTDAAYLPSRPLNASAKFANIFIKLNFAYAFLTLMFALPFKYYKNDFVVGRYVTVNLILVALFWCAVISAIFNLPKNWYDAGYLYALVVIILIFFIGENFSGVFQKTFARKFYIYLGVVSLLSQAVFIQRNLPEFMGGYAGPGVSIVKYNSKIAHKELAFASRACNIDPVQGERVVVDDYTYFYFSKSKWPMAITYILAGNDDTAVRKFFSKIDSDGLVVSCPAIPAPYISFVKKEGNVCCISKKDLKNLVSLP